MHLDRIVDLSAEVRLDRLMRDEGERRVADIEGHEMLVVSRITDLILELDRARRQRAQLVADLNVAKLELARRRTNVESSEWLLERAIRDEARRDVPSLNREQRRLQLLEGMGA